jgi:hypothetical protein
LCDHDARADALLIQAGEAQLRADLNWLSDRGVIAISTSTWPLSRRAINDAMAQAGSEALSVQDRAALERVRGLMQRLGEPAPTLALGYRSDEQRIPHGFGEEAFGRAQASLWSTWAWDWGAVQLRANAVNRTAYERDTDYNLDGSHMSLAVLGQILSLGPMARYWGPAHEGSLILGTAARPVTALSLQRQSDRPFESPWLSWIGRWNYQMFAGVLDDYQSNPEAQLFGLRLSFQPFEAVDFGMSRVIQWAGEGRPDDWDAFWDTFRGASNVGSEEDPADDPGNSIAALDLRLRLLSAPFPVILYGEWGGEDEANLFPAANHVAAGLEIKAPIADAVLLFRAEVADTKAERQFFGDGDVNVTYANTAYADGYYQHGLPLGYPLGGDGFLYGGRVELVTPGGTRYGLHGRRIEVNESDQARNAVFPRADVLKMMSFDLFLPLGWARFGARLSGIHRAVEGDVEVEAMGTLQIDFSGS